MERFAWELEQLIRELSGLPQALFSSTVEGTASRPQDRGPHRRALRRLERLLQQSSLCSEMRSTTCQRHLVVLFTRLSISADGWAETTLAILQCLHQDWDAANVRFWEVTDVHVVLEQLIHLHQKEKENAVVEAAAALWIPVVVDYLSEAEEAAATFAPLLTPLLPVAQARLSQSIHWPRLVHALLPPADSGYRDTEALASFLTALSEHTVDLCWDASDDDDSAGPYLQVTCGLWSRVLCSGNSPSTTKPFLAFWKAMAGVSVAPFPLLVECQLRCTEWALPYLMTEDHHPNNENDKWVLVVFLRALSVPERLCRTETPHLWEWIAALATTTPEGRHLLQGTLLTYTRQHSGQLYQGDAAYDVWQRLVALLQHPNRHEHPEDAWDVYFGQQVRRWEGMYLQAHPMSGAE